MPTFDSNLVVVGAGPYGMAAAIHLRRAGIAADVLGEPMSFWRGMPAGMLLRSNWSASSMIDRTGPYSLDAFRAASGLEFEQPVPLEAFVAYGDWIQQTALPDLDRRLVTAVRRADGGFVVTAADGQELTTPRVVVACGIASFAARPVEFAGLPRPVVQHSSEVTDVDGYAGRSIAVVGGGQSALETAALLAEAGASVEVLIRANHVTWLRGHAVIHRLGRLGPVLYAPTDVGPLWYSRLVSKPGLFTVLPRGSQDRIARRCIRPAGSHWLRARLAQATITFGRTVTRAEVVAGRAELTLDDGSRRTVDHVVLGTGYRVDVGRYGFLDEQLLGAVDRVNGYPVLGPGMESSVPGLYFLGAPAARSFGPIMRFVSGTWHSGAALVSQLARASTRRRGGRPAAR